MRPCSINEFLTPGNQDECESGMHGVGALVCACAGHTTVRAKRAYRTFRTRTCVWCLLADRHQVQGRVLQLRCQIGKSFIQSGGAPATYWACGCTQPCTTHRRETLHPPLHQPAPLPTLLTKVLILPLSLPHGHMDSNSCKCSCSCSATCRIRRRRVSPAPTTPSAVTRARPSPRAPPVTAPPPPPPPPPLPPGLLSQQAT